MSLNVKTSKSYDAPVGAVFQAALGAIAGLEGKVVRQESGQGQIEATFDKKILGKVLGDRTHITVGVSQDDAKRSVVAVEAYPLDAIGRQLKFGAREGVVETVVSWFYAHLEHRLA
jgi:hypothetical protein